MSQQPDLSVVVPVFNEEAVLPLFFQRIGAVLAAMEIPHEVIYVNDGSRDGSIGLLEAHARQASAARVIDFSRNFGHQNAISAGLAHARGRACVVIDSDLQDPPELIPEMFARWKQGFEVVYAVRASRRGESLFKKITAALYYRLLRRFSGVSIPIDAGDFRLVDGKVAKVLADLPERNRYMRGLVSWVGFRSVGVPYERAERAAGQTKYPLAKMVRLAVNGLTAFSHLPLRLVTASGLLCALGSLAVLAWTLYVKFFTRESVQGWTSLMGVVLFLGGMQLVALGVLGEYIAQIFDETKRRPLYIIRRIIEPPGPTR